MDEENKKMKTGRKVVIALIIILLALAAAAYGYGVNYFTDHFLPGSSVNGFNCSYKTSDETEELLAKEVQAYVLAVETRNNGQESITAKQAGLVYKSDGGAAKLIRAQDRYKWFLAFNQKKKNNLATDTVYDDENKLTKAVKALRCMQKDNMEKPVNACIKDNGKTYEIQPEKEGTTLDTKKVQKVIRDAVSAGDTTVNLEKKNCYKKPSVYRDDKTLKKNCAQMNKITSCVITYDFSDRSEQLDRDTIKEWIAKDEKGEYTVDKNQVAAYVNSLGYKYDTFGCTRTFITYDGRQKTITGGDYGWAIDQTTETEWLYNALLAGTTEVRQPAYAYSGLCRNTNDIGNTYVEVDLTNQRMVFYKDGQLLVDTPVVTGCINKGHGTPTGCFALDAMRSPAVLKGSGYAAPVTYWMPFSGGVGIHDATWRSQFGGQIYITNGSHGCVNTPKDQAAIIYNNISVGVPIIVYE